MTDKQAIYFKKAYEMKNMAAAAEVLFVSRTVISRAIIDMEEEYGVPLFIRSKSGVEPTEAGKMVYSAIRDTFTRHEALLGQIQILKEHSSMLLRIGISPTSNDLACSLLYDEFKLKHSCVGLRIEEFPTPSLIQMLESNYFDMIIAPIKDDKINMTPSLRCKDLFSTKIVFAVSKWSQLSQKKLLTTADLIGQPIGMLHTPPFNIINDINNEFAKFNASPRIEVTTSEREVLRNLVQKGHLIALLPDDIVATWKDVYAIPYDIIDRVSSHRLVWNTANPITSEMQTLIDFVNQRR